MSNAVRSITILFKENVSEEYIDMIEKSALCYQGVLSVERDVPLGISEWAIERRIDDKWRQKLKDLLYATK